MDTARNPAESPSSPTDVAMWAVSTAWRPLSGNRQPAALVDAMVAV
jgi:hypothetical protein